MEFLLDFVVFTEVAKAHQELSEQECARSGDHAYTACGDKSGRSPVAFPVHGIECG
jgi:hypothetical protein